MKFSTGCRNIIWIGLFLGIGGLLWPHYAGAFSGPTLDPGQIQYIEIDASVMVVNVKESYVVIAEKRFEVTEFKIDNEIYKTELLNAEGKEISLQSLKKGQYVIVKGIKISKDQIIADSIQIQASGSAGSKKK